MTAFLISILLSIKFEGGLHKSKVPIRIGFENDIVIGMKTELTNKACREIHGSDCQYLLYP